MDKALAACLIQLGCNDKQIRFYRANAEMGLAALMEIAKKARLRRSTAYLVAAELLAMGLISEDHKAYRKLFKAIEPDQLLQKLEAKHRRIGRSTIAFKEALPELRVAYQSPSIRPRVRTFEGAAGLQAICQDLLSSSQEILLWSNQHTEGDVFGGGRHDRFIKERVAKQIPIRVLAVDNSEGRALRAGDEYSLRHTKLLPHATTFTSETYIYGDKVAVLDMDKDIFGVITENMQIADSQRAIFEFAWQYA